MLSPGELFPLVAKHGERTRNFLAGVGGVDHGIDVPTLSRDIRVEETLRIVGFEGRSFFWGGPALEDGCGLTMIVLG